MLCTRCNEEKQGLFYKGMCQDCIAWLVDKSTEIIGILEAIEQWEADLLNTDSAWEDGLPRFTKQLYERWMAIQELMNRSLLR